ncbi:MAG: hypothetical protein ACI4R7_02970, partial [Oliverpabstia sp.]
MLLKATRRRRENPAKQDSFWKKLREAVMGEIKKITQETQNKFLNFYDLETVNKVGREGHYYMASRAKCENELKMKTGENNPDGV